MWINAPLWFWRDKGTQRKRKCLCLTPHENFKADSSIGGALGSFFPPVFYLYIICWCFDFRLLHTVSSMKLRWTFLPPQIHISSVLCWGMQRQQLSTVECHLQPSSPVTSSMSTGKGWHGQGEGDKVEHFFPPPPLCKCVTVRRDIVCRSVGSTKQWLCWPPYKNSRLFSFFLEVLVVCTHVSLLSPPAVLASPKASSASPVLLPTQKPANSEIPRQNFDN